MAHATQTQSVLTGHMATWFADLSNRHAQYRVYCTTLNELSQLTQRDLADLGIDRSMIKSIAFEAAYKE